ncbi:MAG: hypothetical protein WC587_03760 [Candidatus Paceibacterota bacterium]
MILQIQNIKQIAAKIITKKSVFVFVLIAWLGFSVFYIIRDQWQKFQFGQIQVAYQKGVSDTVQLLVNQSENCVPVPVRNGDKTIKMINAECSQSPAPAPTQKKP